MATKTLGTNATTTLTAMAWLKGIGSMTAADQATMCNAIKDDLNVAHPRIPGAFSSAGQLFIPNRGVLRVFEGDWVGVDSQGWPILLSADTIANGPWTHS